MTRRPDARDLWTLGDLCTPWCVHVVATLRIADHMAAGLDAIDDLAAASGTHAESLHRLLIHLASHDLFDTPAPGRFVLNDLSRGLVGESGRLGFALDGIGGRMAYAWGSLLDAVRTGEPAYHTVFGRPFWDDLQAHPEIAASFDALMGPAGHGAPDPDLPLAGGWDGIRTVVDVGGGTGALLAALLRARPGLRGTLVDLPSTVARAAALLKEAGVADRVTTVGQSFFDPLPPGADLYLLKNVLSDWPDREATMLLRRCGEAAAPAGRVLLLGGVSPDDSGAPAPELLMMVLVGGKARSLTGFRALAQAAGLEVAAAGPDASGRLVVECAVAATATG